MHASSILLLSGDAAPARAVAKPLTDRGHRITLLRTSEECVSAIERNGADLLIVSFPIQDRDPAGVLDELKRCDPGLDIIVTGSAPGFGSAQVMERGAFDYVPDPGRDPVALLSAVTDALGARDEDAQMPERAAPHFDALVGDHPSMRATYDFVRRFCSRTSGGEAPTVLLLGETGTGKGLVAKAIHYNSGRRTEPLVEVNCAAIPPSLIESELFGYERGAFTDAKTSRAGLFETAEGGTLFLDEIGSLPIGAQAKVLIAIEEKRVRRLGGRHALTVNVQIIAAAHPVLKQAVKQGEFRDDLYHRLNVLSLKLPPLRERGDDKLRLAETFVAEFCGKYGIPPRTLGEDACERILTYDWPGNVRELRNQIERIILLSDDAVIHGWHFDRSSVRPPTSVRSPVSVHPPASMRVPASARTPASMRPVSVRPPASVRRADGASEYVLRLPAAGISLDAVERDAIEQALDRSGANLSGAARFLSITRQTLMYRMKKHGLRFSAR